MTVTLDGPCDWTAGDCDACSVAVTDAHKTIAVDMLWRLTEGRYGPCEVTVRPCADPSVSCGRCGGHAGRCGCDRVYELVLPGPVVSVVEVTIDGVALDPTDYRIDDGAWLVRLVGGAWPFCQDLTADIDEAGSFAVTYLYGVAPPPGASEMAAELACDVAKALCNDKTCRLPKRATQVVRQGKTISFADLEDGKTGIEIVDLWLSAANRKKSRPRVYSPDLPVVRQTTWVNPESP